MRQLKGGMQFREKLSIEYQVNKDYNNKNLRILKKVVEENIHHKNKVLFRLTICQCEK